MAIPPFFFFFLIFCAFCALLYMLQWMLGNLLKDLSLEENN